MHTEVGRTHSYRIHHYHPRDRFEVRQWRLYQSSPESRTHPQLLVSAGHPAAYSEPITAKSPELEKFIFCVKYSDTSTLVFCITYKYLIHDTPIGDVASKRHTYKVENQPCQHRLSQATTPSTNSGHHWQCMAGEHPFEGNYGASQTLWKRTVGNTKRRMRGLSLSPQALADWF